MTIIVFANPDDPTRVAVMHPTGELPIEELIKRHIDTSKPYKVMDSKDLPNEDNDFYEAWQLVDDTISINISKAREIQRNRLREERSGRFSSLDVQYMLALECGDTTKQQEIAALKQKLRDAPDHPSIDAATTTAELRSLTLDTLIV